MNQKEYDNIKHRMLFPFSGFCTFCPLLQWIEKTIKTSKDLEELLAELKKGKTLLLSEETREAFRLIKEQGMEIKKLIGEDK